MQISKMAVTRNLIHYDFNVYKEKNYRKESEILSLINKIHVFKYWNKEGLLEHSTKINK